MEPTPAAEQGLIHQLDRDAQLVYVPMRMVDFVNFNQMKAIGTDSIGGCSIILVGSNRFGILAHIPAGPQNGAASGLTKVKQMMTEVLSLHRQHIGNSAATAVVIHPKSGKEVLNDDFLQEIRSTFIDSLGLGAHVHYYDPFVRAVDRKGQGTAYIEGLRGGSNAPAFYYGNQKILG